MYIFYIGVICIIIIGYLFYRNKYRTHVYFLSFGNTPFRSTLDRIGEESKNLGIFDSIFLYNENDIQDMSQEDLSFINNNKRGYGYWLWKPYSISKVLNMIPEKSILVYADAGCSIVKDNIDRLYQYITMVNNHESNMLTFELPFLEKDYTKFDVLNEMNFVNEDQINSKQIMATSIIMKNTEKVRKFINTWYNTMKKNNYTMCDDTPSKLPNISGFIDHRHDQSIFSILVKKNNIQYIPDETDGNSIAPIQATRLRY